MKRIILIFNTCCWLILSSALTAQITFCFPDPARCAPDSCFGCYEVRFTTPTPAALPNDLMNGDSMVLTFESTHPRVGELNMQLISPSGNTVTVFDQPGSPPGAGCTQAGIKSRFYMAAPQPYSAFENSCNPASPPTTYAIQGDFKPLQSYSFFTGEPLTGTWTLQVCDAVPANNAPFLAINRPCLTFLNKQKPPCNNATFEVMPMCNAGAATFSIQIRITQAGTENPSGFDVTGDGVVDLPEATGASFTLGPFAAETTQTLTITGLNNANCSQTYQVRCPCMPPTFAAIPTCSPEGVLSLALQVTAAGSGNPNGYAISYVNPTNPNEIIPINQTIGQMMGDSVQLGVNFPTNLLVNLVLRGIDDPTCVIQLNGIQCIDPNAIPTLSEWGIALLILSLLNIGLFYVRQPQAAWATVGSQLRSRNLRNYTAWQQWLTAWVGIMTVVSIFIYIHYGTFTRLDVLGVMSSSALVVWLLQQWRATQ